MKPATQFFIRDGMSKIALSYSSIAMSRIACNVDIVHISSYLKLYVYIYIKREIGSTGSSLSYKGTLWVTPYKLYIDYLSLLQFLSACFRLNLIKIF